MSAERGEEQLVTYEITWMSGHVERIKAHQVSWRGGISLFGLAGAEPPQPERIQFHAEIDGRWTLQLSALLEDVRSVRNCATEGVSDAG